MAKNAAFVIVSSSSHDRTLFVRVGKSLTACFVLVDLSYFQGLCCQDHPTGLEGYTGLMIEHAKALEVAWNYQEGQNGR